MNKQNENIRLKPLTVIPTQSTVLVSLIGNPNENIISQSPTLIELVNRGTQLLACVSDSANLDTKILLAFCLKKEISYLLTWPEKSVDNALLERFAQVLLRRVTGEPIAYITSMKEFWSLPLMVSPATLIPRPDTETLVEQVLYYTADHCESLYCLDLGTGTGAIALALASEKPHWKIDAIDFSDDAVHLAKQNANNLKIKNVTIYQSNWFERINVNKLFNIIVSNPPYIDSNDLHLKQGDVVFEPSSALVSAKNGLADIIHIATTAKNYLIDGGILFFEHGFDQGPSVRDLLKKLGYCRIKTVKDLSGNDRVTFATAIFKKDSV